MSEVLLLLETYDGVIGAVLGTVLGSISTLLATHWLKNRGEITFKVKEFITQYEVDDGFGSKKSIDYLKDEGYAKLLFSVDIYNSSENIKTLNNIHIELVDDINKVLFKGKLKDLDSAVYSGGATRLDDFEFINCKPKELVKKQLQKSFEPSNILLLSYAKKIIIKAELENDRWFLFFGKKVKQEFIL